MTTETLKKLTNATADLLKKSLKLTFDLKDEKTLIASLFDEELKIELKYDFLHDKLLDITFDVSYDDKTKKDLSFAELLNYIDLLMEYGHKENEFKCCICGNHFSGYGNNAQPVKEGTCCDLCNATVVIPARLKMMEGE